MNAKTRVLAIAITAFAIAFTVFFATTANSIGVGATILAFAPGVALFVGIAALNSWKKMS
jgi:hypothetical protein